MLVFIDESYKPQIPKEDRYFTLGVVAIPVELHRDLNRNTYNLIKRFWKDREPDQFEIKGSKLLNSQKFRNSPKNREFVDEILSLCRQENVTTFAITLPFTESEGKCDELGKHYTLLLERINQFMIEKFPDDVSIIVFDETDRRKDEVKSACFMNFMFRSQQGRNYSHYILDTPFFANSFLVEASL